MDPVSRRAMWEVISRTQAGQQTAIVLTTHSMEECEALCNRIGIMVNGELAALGSSSQLKLKYGEGYFVDVTCFESESAMSGVAERIKHLFPSTEVAESEFGRVKLRVAASEMNLPAIFAELQQKMSDFGIRDYAVSQTTLEQVFLSISKRQV
eukprot:TRINITY_DN4159_c0_g2_i3.p2 TRINITY_DN4159_c0_g2~~TRINITY_DN4159_c0_g2_i3.p2  ORF type:complete len:153 (-),score=36.42 TRINITY_DN4159_c0_g2_i3:7-465(-)